MTCEWLHVSCRQLLESRSGSGYLSRPVRLIAYLAHFLTCFLARLLNGTACTCTDAHRVFPASNGVAGSLPMEARVQGARANHVGVEDLEFKSVYVAGGETSDENHAWTAIGLDNVEDAYIRSIQCRHIGFSCVHARRGAMRVTVDDAESVEPVSLITGGRRYAFNVDGAFVLMQNLKVDFGRHDYVSGSRVPGPNVWRNAISTNMQADIGPHHRFGSGQLYEVKVHAGLSVGMCARGS